MSKDTKTRVNRVSEKFKSRLLEIIEDEEYTKLDLGKLAGISKSVIIRATVYGIIPNIPILIRLANFLDLPILYLLGESEDKTFYKSDNPTTFHVRLVELTQEHHTTYCEIAHHMTFPDSYFHDWMRKKSFPSMEFLRPIAEYFKVSVDYLLGRTDYKD